MRPDIPPLRSLRFFAALLVVIFHYNLFHPLFPDWIAGHGYDAVAFFFVLSGFILTYVHFKVGTGLNVTYPSFIWARLVRICPTYFVAIALILALYLVAGILDHIQPLRLFLVLLMLQSLSPSSVLYLNPPAWSLSNEFFFYLLFPVVVWTITSGRHKGLLVAFAGALLLSSFLLRTELSMFNEGLLKNFVAYSPVFNLPQFLVGIAVAYLFIQKPMNAFAYGAAFAAGTFGFLVILFAKRVHPWMSNPALLCFVFATIVFGAAGHLGLVRTVLSRSVLVLLGDASYAIYILHFPIWLWWNHYTQIAYHADLSPLIDFIIYMTGVLAVSVFTLLLIERPIRRALR